MRIISLELENIKSYRRARVDFTPGLNAVCGLNGSGKTTVLEAIGYALFDFIPYSQQAFIREGEKSGMVRLRLLAKDERQYEVVRRIGAGSTYYVGDLDSGLKLTERAENVQDWIGTQALGIEPEADLKAIFKDAVGVPQGMMTYDFKSTSAQRKAVFDPLLRVEEYRDAFETLRDSVAYVKDLSGLKREDIARLETEVERSPHQEEERHSLEQRISECRVSLAAMSAQQADLQSQKQRLDEMAQSLQSVKNEAEAAKSAVARQREAVSLQEKQLAAALAAEEAVKESQPGYNAVLLARARLGELEQQRRERDSIQAQAMESEAQQRELAVRIENLEQQIREATEARIAAEALTNAAGQQDDLEEQLREVESQLTAAGRLEEQIVKLKADIEEIERLEQLRASRLAEAKLSEQRISGLKGAPEELREVRERLAGMKHLKNESERIRSRGQELRKEQEALRADVEARDRLGQKLGQLSHLVAEIPNLADKVQALREEQIHVTAAIDYRGVAKKDLEGLRCPLLEVQCPVVTSDIGVLSGFKIRVDSLSDRSRSIEAELAELTPRLTAAESAQREVQSIEVESARREGAPSRLAEVEEQIATLLLDHERVSAELQEEAELQDREEQLREQVELLEKSKGRVGEIEVLQEQQERDRRTLDQRQSELLQLEEHGRKTGDLQQQSRSLLEQLAKLGDARSRQKHLLGLAERRAGLEENRKRELETLEQLKGKLVDLRQRVEAFGNLNDQIDEQRGIEAERCADYDRYLSNREESSQVEARRDALTAARQLLEAVETGERAAQSQVEQLTGEYGVERHEQLSLKYEQIGKELASRQTDLEHWSKQLDIVNEDLERLALLGEKLQSIRAELGELEEIGKAVDFIRDTIKTAGPAVTETLLTNISRVANDIYAEIMDDHSTELRWERDYEVVLQHGPETRKFSQLSGGEQMSAALAVRLALLKEMSDVDFAFFDEPTENMDIDRRTNLAEQIRAVRGFEQLVVISHDDTFEHHMDNLIRLRKVNEETEVEVA